MQGHDTAQHLGLNIQTSNR